MRFLTPSQCRAARGLLDWSQPKLAQKCNMHVQTVSAFENRTGTPTKTTLDKIQLAFENEGIEFSKHDGVCKKQDLIIKYEDENDDRHQCFAKFFTDVYNTIKDTENEILVSSADERRSSDSTIKLLRKAIKSGIKMRWLIENGNTTVMGNLNDYRWMPDELFIDTDVKMIYADCIAYIMSWRNTAKVIVIKDKNITEEARRNFEYVWKNSKAVTHSTAKIKY